jgi:large subunit ribosomal protein L23
MRDPRHIIMRPILTEKSVAQVRYRKYTFQVSPRASKVEIGDAVERLFPGTRVGSVNTMMVRGKRRRLGGYRRRARRDEGKTAAWKKAVVTLLAGTIPAFEGL